MAITLPRPGAGSSGRRGGGRAPTAFDVPTVRPPTDPGLNIAGIRVPAGAFGGGIGRALEGVGGALTDVGETLQREMERQQKRHDATVSREKLLEVESLNADDLEDSKTQGILSDPEFLSQFESRMDKRRVAILESIEGLSPEAMEDLDFEIRLSMEMQARVAGRDSIQAGKDKAVDVMDAVTNQGSAQAARDPDALGGLLAQLDTRLAPFRGSMDENAFRDKKREARQDYILSAIEGYVRAGRFRDAELLMASGVFDEDLTREQRVRAERMIAIGEKSALAADEKAETALEKELKAAREIRAAKLTDGILEGTITDADLDAALDNHEIDGKQFIPLRKLLKAQEKDSTLEDDPAVVLSLTLANELDILTPAQVIDAFADKQIKQGTMNRFLADIEKGPDDFRVKEQRRMLRENVGGVSGLGAKLGEDATRKVNDALEEFNERIRPPNAEDPKAVREDIESRAIAPRGLETLFNPRFMVGPNKETMDIQATRKATAKALRDGKITAAQAAQENVLIRQIETARGTQP